MTDRDVVRQRWFGWVWVTIAAGVLIAFRAVLVPFILAALLAFVLAPVVRGMERVRWGGQISGRALPRWVAVLLLYICIVAGIVATVRGAAPVVAREIKSLVRNELPRVRTEVGEHWLPRLRAMGRALAPTGAHDTPHVRDDHDLLVEPHEGGGYEIHIPAQGIEISHDDEHHYRIESVHADRDEFDPIVQQARALGAGHTEDLLRFGGSLVGSVVGFVFGFFIMLMLSAYMLVTQERIIGFFASLVAPAQRESFHALLDRIDRGLSGAVRGQLIICFVNGLLSAVGFGLAHLPYWPLLALLASALSIIPIFGSILSSVPAVAVGLRLGIPTALFVLIWIIGIHQLEANVLNPKIMGDAAKIHPVLVVFSLLAGESAFGILGALLAVPAMSIVQSVFLHWRRSALNYGEKNLPGDTIAPAPPRAQEE